MIRKKVLCEVAFWESFSECYPSLMPSPIDEGAIENLKSWMELYSFMFRSNLHFNCSAQQFLSLTESDERLRYLWKKSTGGECGLEFSGGEFDKKALISNPKAILLSGKDRQNETKRIGMMNITPNNYSNKSFLFCENGVSLQHNQEWSWSNLSHFVSSEMANSLLIVDNYLLSTDGQFRQTNLEDNIFEILKALLPDSCDIPFDLTVFYVEGHRANEERLKSFVRDIRPNLEINFNIHQVARSDFHDRTIASNNYCIFSPGGFDLMRRRWDRFQRTNSFYATKSTTVTVLFPFFCSGNVLTADKSYENFINDAKHALIIRGLAPDNRLMEKL